LDSAKIVIQIGSKGTAVSHTSVPLLRGMVPSLVIGSVPSFGSFFFCYVPLKKSFGNSMQLAHSPFTQVLLASSLAAVPSSLVAVPSDVMKKTLFSNASLSYMSAFRQLVHQRGVQGLLAGWQVNLARDVPFVAIKMSLYEGITRQYVAMTAKSDLTGVLSSMESAAIGFVSGMCTAIVTSPLDCVNTRIKSGELAHLNILTAHVEIMQADGFKGLFRGVAHRVLITGFGSTVFWYIYTQLHSLEYLVSPL